MRRSICYTEPNHALAGNESNWKFIFTSATPLAKGAKLRFDFESKGRPIDWQIPATDAKAKKNAIFMEMGDGKRVAPSMTQNPETGDTSFEFTLPSELKSGESIQIHLINNVAQTVVQRKRPFHMHIDPKGKGEYKETETFFIDVRGNQLHTLKIIAPSIVSRNKRFDVIVRFEDIYGNLTANAPEGTLIDLSYQHLRENLNWKLFVPETGFIALPNLYFNEPGVYKIQLKNLSTTEQFYSPPIKCLADEVLSLYWGTLRSESVKVDSAQNIESYLRHQRDDNAMQFCASSSFDSEEETSQDVWKNIASQVAEMNEDDRFVAFTGFQWLGAPKEEGLRQFLYLKDNKPIMRRKDTKTNSLKKIYKTNNPKEMMAIPVFSMGNTTCYDFKDFNSEFERVVEIYNAWGSSECTLKEGNPRPIKGSKKGITEAPEGSIRKALNEGHRFGFVAGGLDDRGAFSDLFDTDQEQYTPGLTAILSKDQNRSSLFESLQNRSCYATTGERIILGLHIAGHGMGSELETKSRPGLQMNRHITGYSIGTTPIVEATLFRNGEVFKELEIKEGKLEFEVDDLELLSKVALKPQENQPPFVYYYLRVMQEDGHIAWSSPIWVEISPKQVSAPIIKKVKKSSGK